MITVHDEDGPCLFTGCGVNQRSPVPGIRDQSPDGCGFGTDNRDHAGSGHQVAIADAQKCYHEITMRKRLSANLLQILDLFADFFELALEKNNPFGQLQIVRFGTNGVDLPIDLLHQEVELLADRLSLCQDGQE